MLHEVGLDEKLFIRHVQCRLLTLLPAVERIEKWEVIKKYFLVVLPKQHSKGFEKNDRYRRICRKLEDDEFPAQVAFLMSVEPIFKTFLCFFQSEGPLIHLLRGAVCELLKSLLGWFIKSKILKDKASYHSTVHKAREPAAHVKNGSWREDSHTPLSKLPEDKQKVYLLGVKNFCVDTKTYLGKHLPIDRKLLRDVSFNKIKKAL